MSDEENQRLLVNAEPIELSSSSASSLESSNDAELSNEALEQV